MPLINPNPNNKHEATKKIAITVKFSVWNELMASGEPQAVLEEILNGWYMERLRAKPVYVVDNNKRIIGYDFGQLSTDETLVLLREKFARETALGRHRMAEATRARIIEVERDLLLKEKENQ